LPDLAVDHLIAAFAHAAGLGSHPGKCQGPEVKDPFPTHDGFGEDLPVDWLNAAELELAIKKLLDED
jgi:hypothetical protein